MAVGPNASQATCPPRVRESPSAFALPGIQQHRDSVEQMLQRSQARCGRFDDRRFSRPCPRETSLDVTKPLSSPRPSTPGASEDAGNRNACSASVDLGTRANAPVPVAGSYGEHVATRTNGEARHFVVNHVGEVRSPCGVDVSFRDPAGLHAKRLTHAMPITHLRADDDHQPTS